MDPTPLILIEDVFVKLECSNPTGSVKDRIARFMLEQARDRGELQPGDVVVETTSGNTGIALAHAGKALGHPVLIFMPEHMSPERRRIMERLGAEVRLTPRAGGFAGAVESRDAYRGRAGYYVPDQFGNPDNPRAHRLTSGPELVASLRERGVERLDAFVAGVGTGGTLMGMGDALREAFPDVRLVAVEPTESNVLSGGASGDHGIMGIGDGFIPAILDLNAVGSVECVSTEEALHASTQIRARHGYCVGVSAGANLVAARRERDRGAVVATLWPDCSDRYLSMGLESPASSEVSCPQKADCVARSQALLGAQSRAGSS